MCVLMISNLSPLFKMADEIAANHVLKWKDTDTGLLGDVLRDDRIPLYTIQMNNHTNHLPTVVFRYSIALINFIIFTETKEVWCNFSSLMTSKVVVMATSCAASDDKLALSQSGFSDPPDCLMYTDQGAITKLLQCNWNSFKY